MIQTKGVSGLTFVIIMWLLSRLVIVFAMQIIAPLFHFQPAVYENLPPLGFLPGFVPKSSWELFSHWDGAWYRKIAICGYDYANDGQWHSIAFFPLFPLMTRAVTFLGLTVEVAGTLVNNLSLLGGLIILYRWAEERYGIRVARWSTVVLAWCPFSLYGTVLYTEGLFLLLTTAALRAFDNYKHAQAALLVTMATATRPTGAALGAAFLLVSWVQGRRFGAYIPGIAASIPLLLFALYCALHFDDSLAFVHVHRAWKQQNWQDIFANALTLDESSLIRVIMFFGGGYLLWHLRTQLPLVAVAYGFCSLTLLLISQQLDSLGRYTYSIVSLPLAVSLLLVRYPYWKYPTLLFFVILLIRYAINFAWWYWVA